MARQALGSAVQKAATSDTPILQSVVAPFDTGANEAELLRDLPLQSELLKDYRDLTKNTTVTLQDRAKAFEPSKEVKQMASTFAQNMFPDEVDSMNSVRNQAEFNRRDGTLVGKMNKVIGEAARGVRGLRGQRARPMYTEEEEAIYSRMAEMSDEALSKLPTEEMIKLSRYRQYKDREEKLRKNLINTIRGFPGAPQPRTGQVMTGDFDAQMRDGIEKYGGLTKYLKSRTLDNSKVKGIGLREIYRQLYGSEAPKLKKQQLIQMLDFGFIFKRNHQK